VVKYHTVRTIPKSNAKKKYHTVTTIPKSNRTKKYHTVGTIPKSNRTKNTTLLEQFQNLIEQKIPHC
jgi:hypothetical protein